MIEEGAELTLIEIKAGRTPSPGFCSGFATFGARLAARADARWRVARNLVVYCGDESRAQSAGDLLAWGDLPGLIRENRN